MRIILLLALFPELALPLDPPSLKQTFAPMLAGQFPVMASPLEMAQFPETARPGLRPGAIPMLRQVAFVHLAQPHSWAFLQVGIEWQVGILQ